MAVLLGERDGLRRAMLQIWDNLLSRMTPRVNLRGVGNGGTVCVNGNVAGLVLAKADFVQSGRTSALSLFSLRKLLVTQDLI